VSVASLYADENFPRQVVEGLRRLGHDVLTCQEAGNAGRGVPDEEVLAFAKHAGRAVLTMDRRDFFRLHQQEPEHAGILLCTRDMDTDGQAARIHDAIASAGALAGKLIRVNRPHS
jgi:predicted nuclease of predicted toxin-antitoxin system